MLFRSDSTWPDTEAIALDMVVQAGLTQEQVNKVIRNNAIDLYSLDLPKA